MAKPLGTIPPLEFAATFENVNLDVWRQFLASLNLPAHLLTGPNNYSSARMSMARPIMATPHIQIAFRDPAEMVWHSWAQWIPADDARIEDDTIVQEYYGESGRRRHFYGPRSWALHLNGIKSPPAFVRESYIRGRQVDILVDTVVVRGALVKAMNGTNWPDVRSIDFLVGEAFNLPPDLEFVHSERNPLALWWHWGRDMAALWLKRQTTATNGCDVDHFLELSVAQLVETMSTQHVEIPPGTPELVDMLAVWADHVEAAGSAECEPLRALLARCPATWRRPSPTRPR